MLVVWPPGLCPLHPLLPCNIRTKTKTPTPTGWSLPALTFLAVLLPPWHWASLAFIPLTPCESPRSHLCFLPLPSHLCWRTRRPPSSLHPGSRTAPTECGACKRMLNHPPCFFLPLLSPSLPRYSFFFFFLCSSETWRFCFWQEPSFLKKCCGWASCHVIKERRRS